ncbi:MAG: M13 family metallopeptidase [Clostridiales bacterium]|nr:M13 family metallopeptidase [Clostridiales bacterium]
MRSKEKLLSTALAIAMSFSGAAVLTGCSQKAEDEKKEATAVAAPLDPKSIRPQDDFYGYINAADLMNMDINTKYGMAGSFLECYLGVDESTKAIINRIKDDNSEYAPGSNEQLIHDYYHQVKNYDPKKSAANEEVADLVSRIRATKTVDEFLEVVSYIDYNYNVNPFLSWILGDNFRRVNEYSFQFSGMMSILGMDFKQIAMKENGKISIDEMVEEALLNYNYSPDDAKKLADEFTYLAIDIANASKDLKAEMKSMGEFTDKQLKEELGFDCDKFLSYYGIQNPYGCYVAESEVQFRFIVGKMMDPKNLSAFQTWEIVSLLQQTSDFLVYDESVDGKKPIFNSNREYTDDFSRDMVNNVFSSLVAELYLQECYSDEKDAKIRALCEDIRESYREVIGKAEWLTKEARESLLKKLESIEFITGGPEPHQVDPKDADLIGKDVWETQKNLSRKKWQGVAEQIKSARPRTGSSMLATDVNACFWLDNVVRITAGISQDPFFDENADYYQNLGGLGFVIAHEIGHAFDSDGIFWDEKGNYDPEWISKEDIDLLNEHAKECIAYYSGFTIMEVYHVDGNLTLPENYADMGAMECVSNIVKTEEQAKVLFTQYTKVWSQIGSDIQAIEYLNQDVHSPAKVRVNAILGTCDLFYETYDVKEGDGMYVAPEKRVSRW